MYDVIEIPAVLGVSEVIAALEVSENIDRMLKSNGYIAEYGLTYSFTAGKLDLMVQDLKRDYDTMGDKIAIGNFVKNANAALSRYAAGSVERRKQAIHVAREAIRTEAKFEAIEPETYWKRDDCRNRGILERIYGQRPTKEMLESERNWSWYIETKTTTIYVDTDVDFDNNDVITRFSATRWFGGNGDTEIPVFTTLEDVAAWADGVNAEKWNLQLERLKERADKAREVLAAAGISEVAEVAA